MQTNTFTPERGIDLLSILGKESNAIVVVSGLESGKETFFKRYLDSSNTDRCITVKVIDDTEETLELYGCPIPLDDLTLLSYLCGFVETVLQFQEKTFYLTRLAHNNFNEEKYPEFEKRVKKLFWQTIDKFRIEPLDKQFLPANLIIPQSWMQYNKKVDVEVLCAKLHKLCPDGLYDAEIVIKLDNKKYIRLMRNPLHRLPEFCIEEEYQEVVEILKKELKYVEDFLKGSPNTYYYSIPDDNSIPSMTITVNSEV